MANWTYTLSEDEKYIIIYMNDNPYTNHKYETKDDLVYFLANVLNNILIEHTKMDTILFMNIIKIIMERIN